MVFFGIVQVILSQIPDFDRIWWLSIVAAIMSFSYSTIGLGLGLGKASGMETHPSPQLHIYIYIYGSICVPCFFFDVVCQLCLNVFIEMPLCLPISSPVEIENSRHLTTGMHLEHTVVGH
jgi:hypothetical protein